MRPAIILTLLALAVLPTFLTGCGNSNLPDTLVVTQYSIEPYPFPPVPYDVVSHDPYDVAEQQFIIHRWQNTDTSLVQRLFNDVSHAPTSPDGQRISHICYKYWYLIAFHQSGHTLAFVRLPECHIYGVVFNNKKLILSDGTFWHILEVDMKIPIAW